mgnify:CR=1 FL=1
MDHWLSASLDTVDVVSHWVQASLRWVDSNDLLQLSLTSLELLFPGLAVWFAFFQNHWLWILTLLEHRGDIARSCNVWGQSFVVNHPTRC